jgi:hypothetical protein
MLEERSEARLAEQFGHLLSSSAPVKGAPQELYRELGLAERLRRLDLSGESQVRDHLRRKLAQKLQAGRPGQTGMRHPSARSALWMGATMAFLFVLLLCSNTPVSAAIQRFFGYGYLPQAGFIRLSDSRIIQGPVTQSGWGQTVTVLQGVQDPGKTTLWISANLDPSALAAPELVLPDHTRLPVQSLQTSGDTVRFVFGNLPAQVDRADLVLPGGWRLPLAWVPAGQVGLAPTQVSVPFLARTPDGDPDQRPCVDIDRETQLCAEAALTDSEGTHLLLQAFRSGEAVPLSWNASSSRRSIFLEDGAGQVYPVIRVEEGQEIGPSLRSFRFFTLPPAADVVTLHISLQAVIIAGRPPSSNETVELPLRLPQRLPVRSPTPGVVQTAPDRPIVIPTPGITRQP